MDLSEQWLVSCNRSGWSCDGGWFAHGYHLAAPDSRGLWGGPESYFPYSARDLPCECPYPHEYHIAGWAYIESALENPAAIKQAILDYGPVSVAVHVNSAFQSYVGGIFNDCQAGTINHAVVLVGWDDSDGVWIMRNSWGPRWGENGYMRIVYGCSRIGYAACYVDYQMRDCNENSVPDLCDVRCGDGFCAGHACGESLDCNHNLIPDECEFDCNGNGVPDDCDIASGEADCNENGTADTVARLQWQRRTDDCDALSEPALINRNLVPDECDLAQRTDNETAFPTNESVSAGLHSRSGQPAMPNSCAPTAQSGDGQHGRDGRAAGSPNGRRLYYYQPAGNGSSRCHAARLRYGAFGSLRLPG